MPREQVGVDIDVTAFDNASKVLRAIEGNLQRLRKNAEATSRAIQSTIPFKAPPVGGIGQPYINRFIEAMRKAQPTIWKTVAPFGMTEEMMPFTKATSTRLFTFGERIVDITNKVSDGFRKMVANSDNARRGLRSVARSFRRAAGTMLWSALGVLGVTWSIQGVVSQSIQPLMKYVDLMSNWSTAAFQVATWLAIARREGFDIIKWLGGKDLSDSVKSIVESGLFLQSTIGNIQSAMIIFFDNILNYTEKTSEGFISVKDSISAFMDKLMEFVNNPAVVAVFGRFAAGVAGGATKALGAIEEELPKFDDVLANAMDGIATLTEAVISIPKSFGGFSTALSSIGADLETLEKVTGVTLPGAAIRKFAEGIGNVSIATEPVERVIEQIRSAKTGAEKFGIMLGWIATFEPIITPIMSLVQVVFTVAQLITFGISVIVDLIAVGAAMLPHLETIAAALAVLASLKGISDWTEAMKKQYEQLKEIYGTSVLMGERTTIPYLGIYTPTSRSGWRNLWGLLPTQPSTVHQNIYFNIDKVESEVDVKEMSEMIRKEIANSTGIKWQ